MIRLLLLCWYFDKFHGRRGGSLQYYEDEVDKSEFINHLLNERHLGEDARETFKRWLHAFTGVWILQGGRGLYRGQKRRRLIFDLLEKAKKRELLIEKSRGGSFTLQMDDRGRDFMRLLHFIEACAREYKYFASIFLAFLLGVGGTILVVFWNKIMTYVANL